MKTKEGYELIPMSEITDEAREIAVVWMECEDKNWIGQKHKLASDIMNYSKKREQQNREEMFEFVSWYSGMERSKIDNAYKRYLKENH